MKKFLLLAAFAAALTLTACDENDPQYKAADGTVVSTNDLGNGCSVWKIRERDTYDGFIFVTHCQKTTDTSYDEAHHAGKSNVGVPVNRQTENGQ